MRLAIYSEIIWGRPCIGKLLWQIAHGLGIQRKKKLLQNGYITLIVTRRKGILMSRGELRRDGLAS